MPAPRVVAVSRSDKHAFSKAGENAIRLLPGLGVEGDAHAGVTVQHRSRVAVDPTQPNLRQVHLIHAELHTELAAAGPFYFAEAYHQQYLAKNPNGYCGLGGTGVSCPIGVGVRV